MTQKRYGLSNGPTPVFNTPALDSCFGGPDGNSLLLDEKNLMRTVETVLFPQTSIELLEKAGANIWKIYASEYPYQGDFYIDDRFVAQSFSEPPRRLIETPSKIALKKMLAEMPECSYIWGSNWPMGIELITRLYPSKMPFSQLDPLIQETWKLKGLDCSGLPYYLTNGLTPRNTSSLIHYGKPVSIEGKSREAIISCVQDLDLIVWKGHVVWIMDQKQTIESRYSYGLVRCTLSDRLDEIMKERSPVNEWRDGSHFVIRRLPTF